MSEDTTIGTDDERGGDDRTERAAELTAQAQALFGAAATDDAEQATDEAEADDAGEGVDGAAETAEADDDADEPDIPVVAVLNEVLDSLAAAEPEAGPEPEVEAEPAPAPVPSFGVIFQAPDLSDIPRRRSRRATSGVTTPQQRAAEPASEVQEDDDRVADTDDLTDQLTEGAEQAPEGQDSTGDDTSGDDAARSGRRRRRGGKGRRGRGQGGEGAETGDEGDESAQRADTTGDDQDDQPAGGADAEGEGGTEGGGSTSSRRRRSRGGRAQAAQTEDDSSTDAEANAEDGEDGDGSSSTRRRRRRRRSGESGSGERSARDEVTSVKGSTRLEAKRQRRREGREAGRRRTIITEAEFLARRESVDRVMVVRGLEDRTQIAVLEDGVPVEHYVSRSAQTTMVGNVYLGRVQNVLPSMEAAFVDIGKGRNAVLYAGEVNWDAAGLSNGEPRRIEVALKSGDPVLVQVTKDPIGHKGARLTSQISLPGRYLVYVPGNSMTGISRKLPDTERSRLKKILKEVVPDDAGVIVRTAAEGAAEAELRADVERLTSTWDRIQGKTGSANAPALLHGEPDMTVRVIRDVFTEDFTKLVVSGEEAWTEVKRYIDGVAPDLADRVEKYTGTQDVFTTYRVHEAIAKAMDRKVWLPSGGSLVIDRTEAMTVVDVNTGKFTGSGGNLEETVTRNNIEAAEEIVRQLRLRDIGGIIVIDFIDMVLESNRDLVVRRLLECLGRDRTKHQVAEVTSLGLVQMTRKRVGSGLIEVFSETCSHCNGRGVIVQTEPVHRGSSGGGGSSEEESSSGGGRNRSRGKGRSGSGSGSGSQSPEPKNVLPTPNPNGPTPAQIAAAAHAAAVQAVATEAPAESTEAVPAEATEAPKATVATETPSASQAETPEVVEAPATRPRAKSRSRARATAASTTPPPAPPASESAAETVEAAAQAPGAESTVDEPPAAKKAPSRARKTAKTAKAAPSAEKVGKAAKVSDTAPDTASTTAPPAAPVGEESQPAAEPQEPAAPARGRRRRGRVVAPAGPPSGSTEGESGGDAG